MRSLVLLACLGGAWMCHADPLFESEELLSVRIAAPLQQMARDRAVEPEERPGTLGYTDADGTARSFAIQIRPRGKSRRDRNVCQFPPLRLNFKKGEVKDTLFDKQDKLKLVTHCAGLRSNSARAADFLWLEYAAYQIFNLVTEQSFRVRPLSIDYVDSDNGREVSQPGFLIEDKDRLAKRLQTKVFEGNAIHPRELETEAAMLVELFQYFLGNTDFSLIRGPEGDRCCHNMVLMGETQFIPVPYDLDITGFVNRPGSLPAEGLGVDRVTQRVYRGFCREPAVMDAGVARFVEKRPEIVALIEDHPWLSDKARAKTTKFVDRFYDTLENPKNYERRIVGECR